jgi:hypothetical protein
VRTIERVVADLRQATRAAALATVRVETPPGEHYGEPDVMVSPVLRPLDLCGASGVGLERYFP